MSKTQSFQTCWRTVYATKGCAKKASVVALSGQLLNKYWHKTPLAGMVALHSQHLNKSWHHLHNLCFPHWFTPHFIQLFPLMYVFRFLRRKGKFMQNCSCFGSKDITMLNKFLQQLSMSGRKSFRYLIPKKSTNKCLLTSLIDISHDLVTRFIRPAIVHGERKQRR